MSYSRLRKHPRWAELKELRKQKRDKEFNKLERLIYNDILRDQKVAIMEVAQRWAQKNKPFDWSPTRVGFNCLKYFRGGGREVTFLAHLDKVGEEWRITYISFNHYMGIRKDIVAPCEVITTQQAKRWATKVLKEKIDKTAKKILS